MYFYEILQEIMNEKSLSIPDVARLSGLTDSTIRSIINRKNKTVALEVAFKLSKGLNVSLKRLNGEDSNSSKANNNTIGGRIEFLINQQNMSKKDFAESIKTHITQLSKIINGDCKIPEVLLCLICQKYNVNKEWLVNGTGEVFNSSTNNKNYIDELIKQYNLSPSDKKVLEAYINMDENSRNLFYTFIKSINKSL